MRCELEIAVDTFSDALTAATGGADRLELAADLDRGGLTPPVDLVRTVRGGVSIPILALVRPGPEPFIASEADALVALRDAEQSLDAGADGIVFGWLRPDFTLDQDMVIAARALAGPRQTVFHRAFDLAPDPFHAIDQLADLGVTRILTAGQSPAAAARALHLDHATLDRTGPAKAETDADRFERIRRYRAHAGGRLQIMPGGGVRASNTAALLRAAGPGPIHSSARRSSALHSDELRDLRAAVDAAR